MLEEYQDRRYINLNDLGSMFYSMAYEGHWLETLEFIAHAYKENSSVRSAIEGERNIQGFFTAYLSVNPYYLIAPEVELNHGFCDLFLMPDLQRYEAAHSYIVELKYLSAKDPETKAEAQWQEAVEQVKQYAVGYVESNFKSCICDMIFIDNVYASVMQSVLTSFLNLKIQRILNYFNNPIGYQRKTYIFACEQIKIQQVTMKYLNPKADLTFKVRHEVV